MYNPEKMRKNKLFPAPERSMVKEGENTPSLNQRGLLRFTGGICLVLMAGAAVMTVAPFSSVESVICLCLLLLSCSRTSVLVSAGEV